MTDMSLDPFEQSQPLPFNRREEFRMVHEGNIDGVVHQSWFEVFGNFGRLLDEIQADPGEVLRGGGGQGVTSRKTYKGQELYWKIYKADRLHRRIRDILGVNRAIKEWEANCAAAEAGIATARIAAAFGRREGLSATYLVVTEPAPGQPAHKVLRQLDEKAREEFLDLLARFVAGLHRKGFWHAHLHLKHLFVTLGRGITLIDLERSFIQTPLPPKKVARNLKQMAASLGREIETREIRRFLDLHETYIGGTPLAVRKEMQAYFQKKFGQEL